MCTIVANGYYTDAGATRSYPTADPRCSEDDRLRVWHTYADGTTDWTEWVLGGQYEGFFADPDGNHYPTPFDIVKQADGSWSCEFI